MVIEYWLQVGAITPQSLEHLLPSIHDCLTSTDWATRKAAADVLSSLALHSRSLVADGAASTVAALEACRFDKVLYLSEIPFHNMLNLLLAMPFFFSLSDGQEVWVIVAYILFFKEKKVLLLERN